MVGPRDEERASSIFTNHRMLTFISKRGPGKVEELAALTLPIQGSSAADLTSIPTPSRIPGTP